MDYFEMIKKDAIRLSEIDEIDYKKAFPDCIKNGMIFIIPKQGYTFEVSYTTLIMDCNCLEIALVDGDNYNTVYQCNTAKKVIDFIQKFNTG